MILVPSFRPQHGTRMSMNGLSPHTKHDADPKHDEVAPEECRIPQRVIRKIKIKAPHSFPVVQVG